MNVVGGVRTDEPAADLPVALAMISGISDRVIPSDLVAFGELGLAGECRAVSELERRINEAARLGFTKAVSPERGSDKLHVDKKITLIPVKSVYEAIRVLVKPEDVEEI